MERKVLRVKWPQNTTKLATYAKYLEGDSYQFVGVVGFRWGMTILIVHITRCGGFWFWHFPFYMSRVERSLRW